MEKPKKTLREQAQELRLRSKICGIFGNVSLFGAVVCVLAGDPATAVFNVVVGLANLYYAGHFAKRAEAVEKKISVATVFDLKKRD